jgi:hypothetical protein
MALVLLCIFPIVCHGNGFLWYVVGQQNAESEIASLRAELDVYKSVVAQHPELVEQINQLKQAKTSKEVDHDQQQDDHAVTVVICVFIFVVVVVTSLVIFGMNHESNNQYLRPSSVIRKPRKDFGIR